MTEFYITYKLALKLRAIGIKQNSLHYYHNRTKEVNHINDIPKIRDFDKFYTSAFVDSELDQYLPDGTVLKRKNGEWVAEYKLCVSSEHILSANAKAGLILILDKKEYIKL